VAKGLEIHPHIKKRLYTVKEATEYLGRGVHGVRDLIYAGELPVIQRGHKGTQYLDVLDLDGWIDRNKKYEGPGPADAR
jgi:hypothetical protein